MASKKKAKEQSEYLSVSDFGCEVGYSDRQVRRLIHDGKIIASRATGRRKWQIPRSEVNRFLGKQLPNTQAEELATPVHKEVNPLIIIKKDEHYQHLLEIVKRLLQNEVDKAFGIPSKDDTPETDDYTIISEESDFEQIPRGYLVERIEHNIDDAIKAFNMFDFWECFVPHLMAEVPRRKDFEGFYENHTIEFIETLIILSRRKTFKGTCPVCKDW